MPATFREPHPARVSARGGHRRHEEGVADQELIVEPAVRGVDVAGRARARRGPAQGPQDRMSAPARLPSQGVQVRQQPVAGPDQAPDDLSIGLVEAPWLPARHPDDRVGPAKGHEHRQLEPAHVELGAGVAAETPDVRSGKGDARHSEAERRGHLLAEAPPGRLGVARPDPGPALDARPPRSGHDEGPAVGSRPVRALPTRSIHVQAVDVVRLQVGRHRIPRGRGACHEAGSDRRPGRSRSARSCRARGPTPPSRATPCTNRPHQSRVSGVR